MKQVRSVRHVVRGDMPVDMRAESHELGAMVGAPPPAGRFLSAAECRALVRQMSRYATGGGEMTVFLESHWTGSLRWARNRATSSGDVRDNRLRVLRGFPSPTGAVGDGAARANALDARRLALTVRRAERLWAMRDQYNGGIPPGPPFIEPYPEPQLWSDSTYRQEAEQRAELMARLVQPVVAAGLLAAGYLEMSATGRASMAGERVWYYPYTAAQYSVTVRTPDGSGSGWAGLDHNDWSQINAEQLSQSALEKCLRSRNPVRLEPGRYTTILEPQAAGDLMMHLFTREALSREGAELGDPNAIHSDRNAGKNSPFMKDPANPTGYSRLGERVLDARLTVRTDCLDPAAGFPPFEDWQVYHPVTWIADGVLKELAYYREYATKKLGLNSGGIVQWGTDRLQGDWWGGRPARSVGGATGAFHMSVRGETASVEEMIATTKRGLLVTRFSGVEPVEAGPGVLLVTGYTRDGLWLIEDGKVTKAVKNLMFTEAPLAVLNSIEQLGVPKRIYNPGYPIVVPPMKVRDFSFTALADAV